MNILIIGGTGVISLEIAKQFMENRNEVTVFNRAQRSAQLPDGIEQITGDRHEPGALLSLTEHRTFDVVIDMISYNTPDAKVTIDTFADRTEHFIFCSSVAAYQRPFQSIPSRESDEKLLTEPIFQYGFLKAEMERYLQSVGSSRNLAITIIRPSLTYGIGSQNVGVLRQNYGIVQRILKGKPLIMFGDGTTPWNFTFAQDLAKAFVGSARNPKTYGQAYHATNSDLHYWHDLYFEFGRILGKEPDIRYIPASALKLADPQLFGHLDDEKKFPSVFDNNKIQGDVPLFRPEVSLRQGLEQLIEWYERSGATVDEQKESLEDALIASYQDWLGQLPSIQHV